jgi:hypothetical protein
MTNKKKPFLNFFCPWEDAMFASIKSYFQSQRHIDTKRKNIINDNLIEFAKLQKEAASNIKSLLNERNSVSQEYYRAKMNLIEKKNKKLELDPRLWELDTKLVTRTNMAVDLIRKNKSIARRFMYSDETKKLRKYADVFAMFNSMMFSEIMYHERVHFRKMVENFKQFEKKNSEAITEFHHVLADLSSNLNDIDNSTRHKLTR